MPTMPTGERNPVLRCVYNLAAVGYRRNLSDRELLERWNGGREQAAYGALVRRHGPMVLRLARSILHNEQDAEDAFQATFLALSRKAASLKPRDSLCGWLYSVAYRIAQKAKIAAARRQKYQGRAVANSRPPADPLSEITLREAHEVLHRELARLADKFRAPLVLCYLEGMTADEAARQLGWSPTTLKGRLEQARHRLRTRLAARGLGLPAALVAALFGEATARGAVPPALLDSTIKAVVASVAPDAAASVISANVVALTEGGLKAMSLSNVKVWSALFVAVAAVAAVAIGVSTLAGPSDAGRQSEKGKPPAPLQKKDARPAPRWQVRATLEGHTAPVNCIAVSRDGKLVASASDDSTVKIWDRAGKELATLKEPDGGGIRGVAFAPDGKTIATAGGDKTVRLYTVAGTELQKFVGHTAATYSVLFTPDGKTLVSGAGSANYPDRGQNGFGEVCFWDPATGKQRFNIRSHTWPVAHLAFTADGKRLITGGYDNSFKVWDYKEDELPKERLSVNVGESQGIYAMALSPTGSTLVVACDGTIKSYEVATGKERAVLEKSAYRDGWLWQGVAVSPDGKTIAAASPIQEWENKEKKFVVQRRSTIMLWDAATGKLREKLSVDECVTKLAFTPDSKTLVGGGRGKMRERERARQPADFQEEKRGPVLLIGLEKDDSSSPTRTAATPGKFLRS